MAAEFLPIKQAQAVGYSIRIQKSFVNGRVQATDQVELSLRDLDASFIKTATTEGNESGLQEGIYEDIYSLAFRNEELRFAEKAVGTTDLGNYEATYKCTSFEGVPLGEGTMQRDGDELYATIRTVALSTNCVITNRRTVPKATPVPEPVVPTTVQASQSSTGWGGVASRAIDGNTDGRHRSGSVSHTRSEKQPWWQAELPKSLDVDQVVVWNRTDDCCRDRLQNFWVMVSDKPFRSNDLATLRNDPAVTSKLVREAPNPSTSVDFGGVQGKYVRVQKSQSGFLSLAEVEIKNAEQSSTGWGGVASRAVDGNTSGKHSDQTVSHTRHQRDPWWQTELPASQAVRNVMVWNRTDCCKDRLQNFWVLVSDKPFGSNDLATLRNDPAVTAKKVTRSPNPSVKVGFGGIRGKYVRVQLEGTNVLSLAEVQVN